MKINFYTTWKSRKYELLQRLSESTMNRTWDKGTNLTEAGMIPGYPPLLCRHALSYPTLMMQRVRCTATITDPLAQGPLDPLQGQPQGTIQIASVITRRSQGKKERRENHLWRRI